MAAYMWIVEHYKPGDNIWFARPSDSPDCKGLIWFTSSLFGYSRGAFIARKVASLIVSIFFYFLSYLKPTGFVVEGQNGLSISSGRVYAILVQSGA